MIESTIFGYVSLVPVKHRSYELFEFKNLLYVLADFQLTSKKVQ